MQEPLVVDQLRDHPVFACCDRRDLQDLAGAGGRFIAPSRWSFVHQGTPAHELYVITQGSAVVFRDRVPIAELGAGDVVGEMAFFCDGQRQATVSSLDRLRAVRIPYRELAAIQPRRPELIEAIRTVCAARHHVPG
jgi:CRP/FNR family cyclic AMP-dependent transcriptional regulator